MSLDVGALGRVIGRHLSASEVNDVTAVQHKAYRYAFLVSGMMHANFVSTISELSPDGAARVATLAQAFA